MFRQRGKLLIPELGVSAHPASRFLQRLCRQSARHRASHLFANDERSILEEHQMFRYSRQRHRQRRSQLTHCRLAFGQTREDCTPRRVGQGEKGQVE
jgi:hypothetical protein